MNDPIAIFLNALTPSAQREFMRLHLEQHGPTYQLHSDGGFKSVQVGVDMTEAMRKFNPVAYALCAPEFTAAGLGRLADDLAKPAAFDPRGAPKADAPVITVNFSGPVGIGKSAVASGLAFMLRKKEFNVELKDSDMEFAPPSDTWGSIEEKPRIVFTENVVMGVEKLERRVGMPPALGAPYASGGSIGKDAYEDALRDAGFLRPKVESVYPFDVVPPSPVTAPDILRNAAQHMQDRAAQRDQPGGERSMRRTVDAFNALLGTTLSERDGWLFMAVLKIARATNTASGALDDYEDLAAFGALAGESAVKA